jgi:hypothetical protein
MQRGVWGVMGVATAALFVSAGQGQVRTMQFDLNNLAFQAMNQAGAPAPFGGTTHSGSLVLQDQLPTTQLVGVLMSTAGGPFMLQPGNPWNLTDSSLQINLNGGNVTGGSLLVDVNGGPTGGGDRYSATLAAAGHVANYVGGGFMVEGLTVNGAFSDATFGTVNVADFFAAQWTPPLLQGSFLTFRIQPNGSGAGFADTDVFVTNIPTPAGSIACLIAGAIIAVRRRRR